MLTWTQNMIASRTSKWVQIFSYIVKFKKNWFTPEGKFFSKIFSRPQFTLFNTFLHFIISFQWHFSEKIKIVKKQWIIYLCSLANVSIKQSFVWNTERLDVLFCISTTINQMLTITILQSLKILTVNHVTYMPIIYNFYQLQTQFTNNRTELTGFREQSQRTMLSAPTYFQSSQLAPSLH